MRKVLYYLMLLLFFACTIWNALSKKDSIMGTGTAAVGSKPNDSQPVVISSFP